MSKRPKSRHRIPLCALEPQPEPISERYQTEVEMSTARLERRYHRAQKALKTAQRRAEHARHNLEVATVSRRRAEQRRYDKLLLLIEDRRRELHQIELLMMPETYPGRDHKRRLVRHESGAITIPLGATTGQRPKSESPPVFPVITKQLPNKEPDLYEFDDLYDCET